MPPEPPRPRPAHPSVMVVDDDPMVLVTLKVSLECPEFDVTTFASPLDALRRVHDREYSVIISDQKMPDMLGLDFLAECRRVQPHSSRILLTAVLNHYQAVDAIERGDLYRFIAKPWLRSELLMAIRNGIERHGLILENLELKAESAGLRGELQSRPSKCASIRA